MLTESESAVAREVLLHGPLSRRTLAARLHLSPASLTRLARPLLAAGVLVELDDDGDGTVGRPSRPLDISPAAGTFIGVKLTGDRVHIAATDIRADLLDARDRPLDDPSPRGACLAIVEAVEALGRDDVRGVGVSLGGHVADGVAVHAPFLDWRDVPLARTLEDMLDLPVAIENDVVALAEAERWFGVGRGIPGFLVVTIGAGVGLGLVVDGRTVRTPDAGIGTVGHLPLRADGPPCPLGHRGCADALLTTTAIERRASRALGRAIGFDDAIALARAGDPVLRELFADTGDALGALCALATTLSLHSDVVLAGEGMQAFDLLRERTEAAISQIRPPSTSPVSLHPDHSGFTAWARGAAAVAIQSAMGRIDLAR